LLYTKKIPLPFNLQVAFLGLPVTFAAYYCRMYREELKKFVTWYGAVIAVVITGFFLLYAGRSFSVDSSQSIGFKFIYLTAAIGIYLCLEIAKELNKGQASRFFAYIGKISVYVLAMFGFVFKLLDAIYVLVVRPDYIAALGELPTSEYYAGVVYVIAGILVPFALVRLIEKAAAKRNGRELYSLKFGKRFFKETLLNTAVCALPIFTGLFFSSMEVFLGNPIDFEFTLTNIWWILLAQSLVLSFAAAFFVCAISQKHRWFFTASIFACGICLYVQALFLNGQMISLYGDEAEYSKTLLLGNAAIWGAIAIIIIGLYYIFSIRKQKVSGKMMCVFVSCAVILMQTTGLVSLLIKGDEYAADKNSFFLSKEGEFELSSGNNLIVFLVDTCDGYLVDTTLEEDPTLFNNLCGFTRYPDTTSTYSRTYPSIPYLLTQEQCYFDVPFTQYVSEAYEDSSFWKDLTNASDDVRIFTSINYFSAKAAESVSNIKLISKGSLDTLNISNVINTARNVGLYRSVPYLVKSMFEYDLSAVNRSVARTKAGEPYSDNDELFCSEVLSGGLTVSDKYDNAFRMYHLFGTHPGNYLDENCNRVASPTYKQTLRGTFKMINSYLDQMRELGVYDNSTIIITADHGNPLSGDHLARETATTTIMLVKPAGAENDPLKESNAELSHSDWFATAIDALGGDSSKYGRTFTEIPEGEERTRTYFYTALYSDIDGEVALREYNITGDSRAFANWHLTGRNWNVDYSERAVSEARLTDEYPDAVILPAP